MTRVLAIWSGLEHARRPVQAGKQACMHSTPGGHRMYSPLQVGTSLRQRFLRALHPLQVKHGAGIAFFRASPLAISANSSQGRCGAPTFSGQLLYTPSAAKPLDCGASTPSAAHCAAACISGPNQLSCCATSHCTGCGAAAPEAGRRVAAVCPGGGPHPHPSGRRRRLRCVNA